MFALFLGKSSKDKVEEVRKMMAEKSAELFVVCALDEVACKIFYLVTKEFSYEKLI